MRAPLPARYGRIITQTIGEVPAAGRGGSRPLGRSAEPAAADLRRTERGPPPAEPDGRGFSRILPAPHHSDLLMTEPPKPREVPKKALRLHGTIARKLGIAIVSGKFQPGD